MEDILHNSVKNGNNSDSFLFSPTVHNCGDVHPPTMMCILTAAVCNYTTLLFRTISELILAEKLQFYNISCPYLRCVSSVHYR